MWEIALDILFVEHEALVSGCALFLSDLVRARSSLPLLRWVCSPVIARITALPLHLSGSRPFGFLQHSGLRGLSGDAWFSG